MTYNIGVAGCGVAGLTVAKLLCDAGHKVVVFDQMETPKPVGSGLVLQETGLTILSQMGLTDAVYSYGNKIERLFGKSNGRVVLDVAYSALQPDAHGLAIHRSSLFRILFDAARISGVTFEFGKPLQSVHDGKMHFDAGQKSTRFDLVIDACGVRSPLTGAKNTILPFGALWATLDWPEKSTSFDKYTLEQRYVSARKMVGVLPIGRVPGSKVQKVTFFWSLKHTDYENWQTAGLSSWKHEVTELWPETIPFLSQVKDPTQLVMAKYAHHTLKRVYEKNVVHIGDSWHAASPQLGQGANMALLDSFALVEAMKHNQDLSSAMYQFQKYRSYHVRLYQILARAFTPVYQSDSQVLPFLRDIFVPKIAQIWPFPKLMALMVAGKMGRPLKRLDL
ncbi:MAG: hypothetical protein COB92_00195 [Robiginitomaculum sp.]|nr:MAG: hypothetical protein COB92_00195 [Robiginitomaculum sp.]